MDIRSFEDLDCWRSSTELRRLVAKMVKKFPLEERYALTDQLKRATRSATANIAEGYGRFHYQENIQFCRQSRGSLYETIDHLIVALDEEYISEEEFRNSRTIANKSLALLNGYINYLKKEKNKGANNN
jgi:four helix bundle protein